MSFRPPLFRNVGKDVKDLFTKRFDFSNDVKVKQSLDGSSLTTETTFENTGKSGEFQGKVKTTYKHSDIGKFEAELFTSGRAKYSLESTKVLDNTTVKLSGDEIPNGKAEVDYAADSFSVSSVVSVSDAATTLEGAAMVGLEGLSVGGQAVYDFNSGKLADYNAAATYAPSGASYQVGLKTKNQADNVSLFFLLNRSRTSEVAGELSYSIPKSAAVLTLGSSYAIDSLRSVKLNVNNHGIANVLYEETHSNNAKIGVAAQFNLAQVSTVPNKVGLHLTLGDI